MDLGLAGRSAIVTGGSGLLGLAVARELAREGVSVAICGRRMATLRTAADNLTGATRGPVMPVVADTTDGASVQALVESVTRRFGRVDILVNAAANPGGGGMDADGWLTEAQMLEDLDVKVVGYYRCARAVLPMMAANGWGRVINIGGISGRTSDSVVGLRNAAVTHLSKSLADRLARTDVTVNAVHPGVVGDGSSTGDPAVAPLVSAEDVAGVVAFLASQRGRTITGASIDVSAGAVPAVYL